MYFKKLPESMQDKKIWWTALADFSGWKDIETGTVIEEDIQRIEKNIIKNMQTDKVSYIKTHVDTSMNDSIILPYDILYNFDIHEFVTTSEIGEETSFVEWKVETDLYYPYILRSDLEKWIEKYLLQRSENETHHTEYDRNGIVMYDKVDVIGDDQLPAHFLIPTKVPVIKTYNIESDALWIINEVKDRIVWLDKEVAKDIILSYEEIDAAEINISPRRFSIIPGIKSRIKFKFGKEK